MLDRWIDAALANRWLVLFGLLLVVAVGTYTALRVPIDAFPDLTNNQVVVITETGPMSPNDVERLVTFPIETALMGIPKMIQLRSISKLGLSIVTVVLDDSVNTYFGRQLVSERLREVRSRLPQGVEPVLGPVATAFGEVYQYTVESQTMSLMERKTLQDWVIRPQLRTVPGVNEVNSWGGLTRQIAVQVEPAALQRYGLTVHEILQRVQASNAGFGGGFIEHEAEQYNVLGLGRALSPRDLEQVVLIEKEGTPVLLRDVAVVEDQAVPRQGAVLRDARGETVCGMTIMLKGENSRDVIQRIKDRLSLLPLPPGVSLTPFYDQSQVIDTTIATVRRNLLEAGLLVTAVLLLFLGEIRAALIVTLVIPVAMLFGFMGMAVFGVSANLMSLGAVDFGMIVDGAVVMMENAIRHLGKKQSASSRRDTIRLAAREVARPITFGVIIIIAVYLPVFFLEDLEGRMFRPMAITVCSALLGSLALAILAVPVLGSFVLREKAEGHGSQWFERVSRLYGDSLGWALSHPRWVIGSAVMALAGAVGSIAYLGTEFMPRLDEGSIVVQTKKLPGINVASSVTVSQEVEKIILSFPEVGGVVTKLGRPDVATEAMGVYEADVYVLFKQQNRWLPPAEKESLISRMSQRLERIPGMTFNFTQPMAMRMDEVISGVKADVAVKVFGEDAAQLERIAERVRTALRSVPGVADLQMEMASGVGELRVEPNRMALARYGLTIADLAEYVDSATGGRQVSEFVEGQRRFPLVVRFPQRYRSNPGLLGGLVIKAPTGEQVRLDQIARLSMARGPEIVSRENGQRRIVVQSNVRGRDLGSFVQAARQVIERNVQLPAGYWLDWGGQFENQQRASRRLMILLPASVFIIFCLLYATFQSVRQALLIFCAVPFALIGGIAALWARGLNLNLSASIGFIALFGVAVLNGIVMVTMINQLRGEGMSTAAAVRHGAALRLQPVLMTALVASLGFLPMTASTAPGSEVQRPLATVVVGGLLTATLLTLYLLPILYPAFSPKDAVGGTNAGGGWRIRIDHDLQQRGDRSA